MISYVILYAYHMATVCYACMYLYDELPHVLCIQKEEVLVLYIIIVYDPSNASYDLKHERANQLKSIEPTSSIWRKSKLEEQGCYRDGFSSGFNESCPS